MYTEFTKTSCQTYKLAVYLIIYFTHVFCLHIRSPISSTHCNTWKTKPGLTNCFQLTQFCIKERLQKIRRQNSDKFVVAFRISDKTACLLNNKIVIYQADIQGKTNAFWIQCHFTQVLPHSPEKSLVFPTWRDSLFQGIL